MENGNTSEIKKKNLSDIFSISALIISIVVAIFTGLTFYYQNVREYYDVKASILSAEKKVDGIPFIADIIFINSGNRQCSVASVFFEQKVIEGGWIGMNFPASEGLPFSLKPGDVISKQFEFNKMGTVKISVDGKVVKEKKEKASEWNLVFCVVDSKGGYHRIKENIFYRPHWNEKGGY